MKMNKYTVLYVMLLLNMVCSLVGFRSLLPVLLTRPSVAFKCKAFKCTALQCIQKNHESYYNTHAVVNNQTKDIARIYTTYDNRHTIVFYRNGSYDEHLNKSLRLKYSPDVLNIHIVSNAYFTKIYKGLKDI